MRQANGSAFPTGYEMVTIDGRRIDEADLGFITNLCRLLQVEVTNYWISIPISSIVRFRSADTSTIHKFLEVELLACSISHSPPDARVLTFKIDKMQHNVIDLALWRNGGATDLDFYDPFYFLMKYVYSNVGDVNVETTRRLSSYINVDEMDFFYAIETLSIDGFLSPEFIQSCTDETTIEDFFDAICTSGKWKEMQNIYKSDK